MDALDLSISERTEGVKLLQKASRRKASAPQRRQHNEGSPVIGEEMGDEIEKENSLDELVSLPRPSSEESVRSVPLDVKSEKEQVSAFKPNNILGELAQKILAARELSTASGDVRRLQAIASDNSRSSDDSPDGNLEHSRRSQSSAVQHLGEARGFLGTSGVLGMDDLMQQRLRRYLNDVQPAEAPGIPERTKKQNRWAFNVWREWARKRNSLEDTFAGPFKGVPLDVGQASEEELDYWLCKFVMEIRRKDGNPYPPHTLMQIVMGIQRYLRQQAGKPTICILDRTNTTYSNFRSMLDVRIKELTDSGAVSMKSRIRPVVLEHAEDKYERCLDKRLFPPAAEGRDDREGSDWKNIVLSTESAQGLLNSVFWHNYKTFGIHCISDHWNLRADSFRIHKEGGSGDVAFLEFTPPIASALDVAGRPSAARVFSKKIYSDSPQDGEIFSIYQNYLSRIPNSGPFYRHPVDPTIVDRSIKFSDQWVGKNRLRAMLKHLIEAGSANSRLKDQYAFANRKSPSDNFITPLMRVPNAGSLSFPPPSLQGSVELLQPLIRFQQQHEQQQQQRQHRRSNPESLKEIDEESYGENDFGQTSPKRFKSESATESTTAASLTNVRTRTPNRAATEDEALEITVPNTIKSITVIKCGRKITFHLE